MTSVDGTDQINNKNTPAWKLKYFFSLPISGYPTHFRLTVFCPFFVVFGLAQSCCDVPQTCCDVSHCCSSAPFSWTCGILRATDHGSAYRIGRSTAPLVGRLTDAAFSSSPPSGDRLLLCEHAGGAVAFWRTRRLHCRRQLYAGSQVLYAGSQVLYAVLWVYVDGRVWSSHFNIYSYFYAHLPPPAILSIWKIESHFCMFTVSYPLTTTHNTPTS